MENPIKHCAASVMHTRVWNDMRDRQAAVAGRGSGNKQAIKHADQQRNTPLTIKEGEPTRYAMALKKWGFGSREAARNFCNKNKEK
jgi:hypothetical protein